MSLKKLKKLVISENYIETLPEIFMANFPELEELDLSRNKITTMPFSIHKMKGLKKLDITKNPIYKKSSDSGIGGKDLVNMLGNKLIYNSSDFIVEDEGYADDPTILKVFDDLSKNPVCWNLEIVGRMRKRSMPQYKLGKQQVMKIWKRYLVKRVPKDMNSQEMIGDIGKYVKQLYNIYSCGEKIQRRTGRMLCINGLCRKRFSIDEKDIEPIKDFLIPVFVRMVKMIKQNKPGNKNIIADQLLNLSFAITQSSSTQIKALWAAYSKIYGKKHILGSLDAFLESEIAVAKNEIFESLPWSRENRYTLSTNWRYYMRNLLGLECKNKSRDMIYREDPYRENRAECMKAFYSIFTPEYMINRILKALKMDECKTVGGYKYDMSELSNEIMRELGNIENSEGMRQEEDSGHKSDNDNSSTELRYEGIEELLVRKNILIRKGNDLRAQERKTAESVTVKLKRK